MRFRRGLIVGKFSPLHRGHQYLIERALAECEELVLLSYAKPELPGCDTVRRRRWLTALYPQARSLVVDDSWLAERGQHKVLPDADFFGGIDQAIRVERIGRRRIDVGRLNVHRTH